MVHAQRVEDQRFLLVDHLGQVGQAAPVEGAGVAVDVAGGVAAMAHGDLLKGAEKLAPRFAAGPLKAIREGTAGVTTASNQPVYYGN